MLRCQQKMRLGKESHFARQKYYPERNGLLGNNCSINLYDLCECFFELFCYFEKKNAFELAFTGRPGSANHEAIPALMAPSPRIFFLNHLGSDSFWPIREHYEDYAEETLFGVIEILYDHIAYSESELESKGPRASQIEFASYANGLLLHYDTGYYLTPAGYIMHQPNPALCEQLTYSGEGMPDEIFCKMQSICKEFYRFDSGLEKKREAIVSLARLFEPIRKGLADLLNEELGIAKKQHDKLIFEIVNTFNLRHSNAAQKEDYDKNVWYEWMMQYYTSTLIAFYRINDAHSRQGKTDEKRESL